MIDAIIRNLRTKLPIQNPLHSFVHNNILQMFEHKEFHEAIHEAGILYRATPYWPVYRYIEKFNEKQIVESDLKGAIHHYLGLYGPISSLSLMGITPAEYYYRLMFSDLTFNDVEPEANLERIGLWEKCLEKMSSQELTLSRSVVHLRGRGYWEKYHNESYAISLHPQIIRLISSFLDQGQGFWPNPFRENGLWEFFHYDILETREFAKDWQKTLVDKVVLYRNRSPEEVIETELREKRVPEAVWESYLLEILFDLKGWAGMVNKLELEPWQATVKAPKIKLVDYIAMALLFESAMDEYHANSHSIDLSLILGREDRSVLSSFELSLALYQITTSFGLAENWYENIPALSLLRLIDEVDASEHRDRIRLWHEAYEHHFHRQALEAVGGHRGDHKELNKKEKYAQIFFCIDDREESMRRYVEEVDEGIETFGVVGFFGIDMKFSSIKHQRLIAQCPPVIVPSRLVREVSKEEESFKRWNTLRGLSDLKLYYNSRTLFRGFLTTLSLGLLSLIPMFVQVFFPERSKLLARKLFSLIKEEPNTDLQLERRGEAEGYTKSEMANIVETIVKMCGNQSSMTDIVVILGHGSSSSNNPFRQAYGCGACGGNAGVPNTRAFVKMANDPEVRDELKKRGLIIGPKTFFVSALHDTCTDDIHFYNENEIPVRLRENFQELKRSLAQASKLNAFERCQRFSTFTSKSVEDALEHVHERAFDLAQPRPEYGHSSNALAIVGPRKLTKGLFLNRRSFLLSYDWRTDPQGEILKQIVLGGIPVAVNINMDYYFSAVDNDNFGCGSKLPLNLTSLLGVMTGPQSDLRIGLARQMVEIHEPIRNLTIIEAPLENVKRLFDSHPRLRNILYQHWMKLAVKDPTTQKWWSFIKSDFEEISVEGVQLERYASSLELVKSSSEVDFAEVGV